MHHHHRHGGGSSTAEAQQIIDQLDTSGSGALSLSDIQSALGTTSGATSSTATGAASPTTAPVTAGSTSSTSSGSTLAQGFAKLDTNSDGQISLSELSTAIQSFRQAQQASWSAAWAANSQPTVSAAV